MNATIFLPELIAVSTTKKAERIKITFRPDMLAVIKKRSIFSCQPSCFEL